MPYWRPEQPPPATQTRSAAPCFCSLMSPESSVAARSVRVIISILMYVGRGSAFSGNCTSSGYPHGTTPTTATLRADQVLRVRGPSDGLELRELLRELLDT